MAATQIHKPRKGDRLVARVSPEDKAIIARAAAIAGQSVGSFVLAQARNAAIETLETRERIVLNAGQSRRFVEALLAPPRPPTERMKRAMEIHRQTVSESGFGSQAPAPSIKRPTSAMGRKSRPALSGRKPKAR